MRFTHLVGGLGLVGSALASRPVRQTPRDYLKNDYYLLHLDDGVSPQEISRQLGLQCTSETLDKEDDTPSPAGFLPRKDDKATAYPRIESPNASALTKQREVMDTLEISDPIFKNQWHLLNTIQVGHDVNVTGVWLQGIKGKGSIVAMVDDGLDMSSLDLKDNYYAEGSWDFNDPGPEPRPRLSDDHHGTRCAGEIAAVRNDVCGVGVAYEARVSGLRILSKLISDEDEAVAMTYDYQNNQIYSCSWGPPDDGRSMEAPGIPIRQAMLKGIQDGRGGLGSIYVFASGNGAANEDNCNFDGYTNSIYSITVGAVDRAGKHPYYSEHCSAQLVVTYSSGSSDAIHTTDVGTNKCYTGHGGTSAAAPLAAGILALVLEARPELTWRDTQYILMNTAVRIDDEGADWRPTSVGRQFSHTFGYGKIDTYGAVELAKTWSKVKPQAWFFSPWIQVNKAIPQGEDGLSGSFEITAEMLKEANLERVEHVTVTMNVNHTRRGDLSVDLISPDNVISHIATTRKLDTANTGYIDWTFMSVAHWGESGIGKWTIVVRDTKQNEFEGAWEDDDNDHANDHASIASTTGAATATTALIATTAILASTVSLPTKSATADPATATSSEPNRPQISKPTGTQQGSAEQATTTSSSWVSWLPSFGVSSRAQVWIYGALALIIAFCVGLGIYLWMARRKQLRNNQGEDYEFEPLAEDPDGYAGGEKGSHPTGQSRRTRGGELYDAFAGGSDDDSDFEVGYRDGSDERLPLSTQIRDEEEPHHVIGEDDDEDDEDYNRTQQNRLLDSGR
ncbi:unnamed protein product [Parascedosporium putredinis]|uniref:P/Homo B domain-containing protein n=1 Tax=Parascedosporium putredinis TaxID=1442378 RepID=A0A9P1HB31_9PEZI|nr:unnamed protein product [Parascedosporium putredinis]CAI8003477.1 unnamed protein product [Parascedosporium putredinis]